MRSVCFPMAFMLLVLIAGASAHAARLNCASKAGDGTLGNARSGSPSLSTDGRYLAFASFASNLVANDTNESQDIFVRDRLTGQTTRVSVAGDGTEGNAASFNPCISADGRFIAFDSDANNLVADDTNMYADIFVHDRQSGETTRASMAGDGTEGNYGSFWPSLSADGRYVAFDSDATTLVANDANGVADIFVHDRQTGMTTRVSMQSDGSELLGWGSFCPSMSADGLLVAFESIHALDGIPCCAIFVHDRQTGVTAHVSVAGDGTPANDWSNTPCLSADGRVVAFHSQADNLAPDDTNAAVDIFVHDLVSGDTTRVSIATGGAEGDGGSYLAGLSADGRYVTFASEASNLAPDDLNEAMDVFVHDRQTGHTTRVSVSDDGAEGNAASDAPCISANGYYVAFASEAGNLAPGDDNGAQDIFLVAQFSFQPDLLIQGANDALAQGNDVYAVPEGQTATARVGRGIAAIYRIHLENDGTASDTLLLTGTGDGPGWRVRYFDAVDGGTEITASVTGIDGWLVTLAAGAGVIIRAEVTPDDTVLDGIDYSIALAAVSMEDPAMSDTVYAVTTRVPLSAVALSALPLTACVPGNTVTLTAIPTGGSRPRYRFYVRPPGATSDTDIRGYAASSTCLYTAPATTGIYKFLVLAREEGETVPYRVYKALYYTVKAPLTAVALAMTPAAPIVEQSLLLTATPTNGAHVEYRFFMRGPGDTTDVEIRPYGPEPSMRYTPLVTGSYKFLVLAREQGSPAPYQAYQSRYVSVAPHITELTLTPTPTTQRVGQPVILEASANGGGAALQYRFELGWMENGVRQVRELQAYSTLRFCDWTPMRSGWQTLVVYVREQGYTGAFRAYTYISYQVMP